MDAELVKQLELIRDDQVLAVNTKAAKIITVLTGKGLVYDQVVPPALMLVHCQNRAGKMVNSFDVHGKGYQASKVGWSLEKLGQSYCFELPQSLEDRDRQVKAMKLLVDSSEGRLAPLTGADRFVFVSSSHMSQFCRSVGAGCKTEEENLLAINKTLSLESLMLEFQDIAPASDLQEWSNGLFLQEDVAMQHDPTMQAPHFGNFLLFLVDSKSHHEIHVGWPGIPKG